MTLGTRLTFSERPLFPPCRPWRSSPTGSPTAAADSVRARWHVPLTAWAPRTRAPLRSLGLDQLQAGRSATCALGAHRGLTKGVTRTPSATPQAKRTPARAHAAASRLWRGGCPAASKDRGEAQRPAGADPGSSGAARLGCSKNPLSLMF